MGGQRVQTEIVACDFTYPPTKRSSRPLMRFSAIATGLSGHCWIFRRGFGVLFDLALPKNPARQVCEAIARRVDSSSFCRVTVNFEIICCPSSLRDSRNGLVTVDTNHVPLHGELEQCTVQ